MRRQNGAGSVYKDSSGCWHGRVIIGVHDNGRYKFRTFSGRNQAEVKKQMDAFNEESSPMGHENLVTVTEAFLYSWFHGVKSIDQKPSTRARTLAVIEKYIVPAVGKYPLTA